MQHITLTLLAAVAIGALSIAYTSAMPFNNVSAALGESQGQDVRVSCDRYRGCYNTRRSYRSYRSYRSERRYSRY